MNLLLISCQRYSCSASTVRLYEFHINRSARIKYQVDDVLFESTGNVIFPNFRAVRQLAYSINQQRRALHDPSKQVRVGKLNALGLLDEINHFLVKIYNEQENPGALKRAYQFLEKKFGTPELENTLQKFLTEYPPKSVYKNEQSLDEYFSGATAGRSHKEIALEEMVMLYLTNLNPAIVSFKELFDESVLAKTTSYYAVFAELDNFFSKEKHFGPENKPLIEALKSPILAHPDNIEAQLGFLKDRWGIILSAKFLDRILSSFEFSNEEEKYFWNLFHPTGGKPDVDTFVPQYKKTHLTAEEQQELLRRGLIKPEDFIYDEPERFTPDIDWMPNVVLIAKNTYVWLDQLSKKYQRSIKRLDEIPDEELDQLAQWNFKGLWLIGVWERSHASKKIKQINGNLDAVSSAYSLYDYEIAYDLGGEEAFQNLNHRAWQRGIRLAGDMVPNHMGIFSKWVIEHPEYFIQSEHPPYPNYRFTGHNLSEDPNIELRIEDGYWSKSDAAVVFQRYDRRSGEVRYFYHGNDGTSMPWNDTAQLNLLRADVREAIIQNIFHVARKFSIIRFDAAMTLAKKHYQRLWFPMPGTSGVPSRQDHSLSRNEFDTLFPKEFWREVVDRFNAEMPQTLLLAEAFWLMEGYFVRTLGMHRVYNSAFMHMMMKEENEKYRALIKNTLEFNPEILKRYVNFMSNPDEQTAIEQFGKDDKYFGVAMMMVTLPGLPMFAHGQVEGYGEKYGMEYQRAYYNETPDEWLVRRHERELFPLMQKRYLFSHVHNFEFYDFLDERGFVNENVFAYSNRAGNERAIIFFHNKYSECRGYIKHSLQKSESEGGKIRSVTLSEALNIQPSENMFYRFRERRSNLEYLVSGKHFSDFGWWIELRAFQYAVFTDFAEMYDATGDLAEIAHQLHARGTENLDMLLRGMQLRPLHAALRKLISSVEVESEEKIESYFVDAVSALEQYMNVQSQDEELKQRFSKHVKIFDLYFHLNSDSTSSKASAKSVTYQLALLYHIVAYTKQMISKAAPQRTVHNIISDIQLEKIFGEVLQHNTTLIENHVSLFSVLLRHHDSVISKEVSIPTAIDQVLEDFDTADFLGVNQHEDVWYFNKEQFEFLMTWVITLQFLYTQKNVPTPNPLDNEKKKLDEILSSVGAISLQSEYKVEKLKELSVAVGSRLFSTETISKKIVTKKGNKTTSSKRGTKSRTKPSNVKNITKGRSSH